ncbi:membrane protein [Streptomyces yerevanensis]|uniref:membrane protein n=1 Tax=Streptomyces yerevanensis TaxID=66378 RepID=UPI0005265728|nr:membrane protein [Streptomyces yerevanensis]
MWPGEQPPTGGQPNPYQQPGYQQPSPYQQPGYQQPNPYQQGQWTTPTVPSGAPQPPQGGGGSNKTKLIAIVAAAAVVVASGVTGFVLLGGDKEDKAEPDPAKSSTQPTSSGNPRGSDGEQPTIAGWKAVVNPKTGIAFDVPADWALESPDWVSYVTEDDDPEEKPLAAFAAPAFLESKWCGTDEDKDGSEDYTPLAGAGTRGNNGAKSTEEIARADSNAWVYGAYTQPEKTNIDSNAVESYTTKSGITGSVGTAWSTSVKKSGKCDSDGKSTVFGFKNADGDFVSWSFHGAKGVSGEVPDATVKKILSTVRLYTDPSGS